MMDLKPFSKSDISQDPSSR